VKKVVEEVIIVLGHHPEALKPLAEALSVDTVINIDYDRGMTSSFQLGLSKLRSDTVFLVLGDQIGITSQLMKKMIYLMEKDSDALIISPVYKGKKGHPVLFRKPLLPEILDLDLSETIKDLVDTYEDAHRFVEGSPLCVMNFNTPEEFKSAVKIWRSIFASP
jgi:molybdenum cofactor cytidylyltransferase